ncbi:hypothetical protein BSKO_10816 [Bryopsis sp. KO-2023]|nr:hypothetical protein BSKO_10816 [Bryopsis sp. KO-2023]
MDGGRTVEFHCKDILEWTKQEFGNEIYRNSWTLEAKMDTSEGARIFSDPSNSDGWIDQQNLIQERHGEDTYVVPIVLYSDKTRVNDKGLNIYPIRAALLSVDYEKRTQCQTEMGFIPIPTFPNNISEKEKRKQRLAFLHTCIEFFLAPLKHASAFVHSWQDPNGVTRKVVPRVILWVGDNPEQCDMTLVKHKHCPICLIKKTDLNTMGEKGASRRVRDHKEIVELAEKGKHCKKLAEERAEELAVHIQECALHGFADEDFSPPYQWFTYEELHDHEQGTFLYIVNTIKDVLRSGIDGTERMLNQKMTTLNSRLIQD